MKRATICVAAALVTALAAGMVAGCSSQPASSASGSASGSASSASASAESASAASASSESASAASEQSNDEVLAELKDVSSKMPAFKSVTITDQTVSVLSNVSEATTTDSSASAASSEAAASESAAAESSASAESSTIASTTVYKFDESGDKVRTSVKSEIEDITLQYFTEGDDAVCVTDGPAYSGTTDQFGLEHAAGAKAYLESATGDLNTIFNCVKTATKSQQDGMTVYELTLDPEKRIASDEVFQILADAGDPVQAESIILGFDDKGYLVWANEKREFKLSSLEKNLMLTDFDNTTVEPMPKADKTYEEMEADIDEKYDAFFADLDKNEAAEGEASSEAAEAK